MATQGQTQNDVKKVLIDAINTLIQLKVQITKT